MDIYSMRYRDIFISMAEYFAAEKFGSVGKAVHGGGFTDAESWAGLDTLVALLSEKDPSTVNITSVATAWLTSIENVETGKSGAEAGLLSRLVQLSAKKIGTGFTPVMLAKLIHLHLWSSESKTLTRSRFFSTFFDVLEFQVHDLFRTGEAIVVPSPAQFSRLLDLNAKFKNEHKIILGTAKLWLMTELFPEGDLPSPVQYKRIFSGERWGYACEAYAFGETDVESLMKAEERLPEQLVAELRSALQ